MLGIEPWAKVVRLAIRYGIVFLSYGVADAAASNPISLQEAIQIALKENLDIQMAVKTRKGALLSNRMAHIHLWAPKATFLLSQDNKWEKNQLGAKTKASYLQSDPVFTVTWELKSVLNKIFQTKIYRQDNLVVRLTATKAIEKELQEVVTCHYELALAQKKGELLHTFIKIAATKLQIEEERFRLGFSSKVDCLNADLSVKKAKFKLLAHQETLKEKCRNLNLRLGKPLNQETVVASNSSIQPLWDITAVTKEKVVDLEAAIQEKKVAIAATELTRAKCYPLACLSLSSSIYSDGYRYHLKDRNHGKWDRASYAGGLLKIGISVDVAMLLLMPSEIRKARMAWHNEKFKLAKEKLIAEDSLETKKWTYHHMLGLHKLVKEQLKVSNQKLVLVKENYRLNQLKLLDLQEAEEEVQKAEMDVIHHAFKVKQAEFDLYRLIGNVSAGLNR